jgi:hypothetical protein
VVVNIEEEAAGGIGFLQELLGLAPTQLSFEQ